MYFRVINNYIFKKKSTNLRLKRKFIFFGFINTLLTNFILQFLILFFDTGISTFISQSFNSILGYFLYAKKVFNVKSFRNLSSIRYLLLSIFTWNINWFGIKLITQYSKNENFSALIMVPILAIISFILQKYLVFKKYQDKY